MRIFLIVAGLVCLPAVLIGEAQDRNADASECPFRQRRAGPPVISVAAQRTTVDEKTPKKDGYGPLSISYPRGVTVPSDFNATGGGDPQTTVAGMVLDAGDPSFVIPGKTVSPPDPWTIQFNGVPPGGNYLLRVECAQTSDIVESTFSVSSHAIQFDKGKALPTKASEPPGKEAAKAASRGRTKTVQIKSFTQTGDTLVVQGEVDPPGHCVYGVLIPIPMNPRTVPFTPRVATFEQLGPGKSFVIRIDITGLSGLGPYRLRVRSLFNKDAMDQKTVVF